MFPTILENCCIFTMAPKCDTVALQLHCSFKCTSCACEVSNFPFPSPQPRSCLFLATIGFFPHLSPAASVLVLLFSLFIVKENNTSFLSLSSPLILFLLYPSWVNDKFVSNFLFKLLSSLLLP